MFVYISGMENNKTQPTMTISNNAFIVTQCHVYQSYLSQTNQDVDCRVLGGIIQDDDRDELVTFLQNIIRAYSKNIFALAESGMVNVSSEEITSRRMMATALLELVQQFNRIPF